MEKVKARELLEIIFPFWVEEETAKPVTRLALAETAMRGLSLDTNNLIPCILILADPATGRSLMTLLLLLRASSSTTP